MPPSLLKGDRLGGPTDRLPLAAAPALTDQAFDARFGEPPEPVALPDEAFDARFGAPRYRRCRRRWEACRPAW